MAVEIVVEENGDMEEKEGNVKTDERMEYARDEKRLNPRNPYTRRIDITAFKESTRSGYIIDPTVRFETDEEQTAEVDNEKKNIYNPTIPYYLKKYQLKELEVIGLLVGARVDTIVVWSARSPDLTPLDFILWGWMKEKVYQTEIASREELVAKINTAAMEIHQHGMDNVQRDVSRRAEACVRARGGHFEHLL
ncbi:hypothetical protein ANN_21256 [Periplaneta americana]|uniref:Uncharacterized protein n=1 Tax=Periplaneta americana TaxID=6978 RepID=A0ABQ8SF58_PERAM|nr:hypothetical protein ANN_21256 [Periplaneta americana]